MKTLLMIIFFAFALATSNTFAGDLGMFGGKYGCAETRGAPSIVNVNLFRGQNNVWLIALNGQNMPEILGPATALNRTAISQDAEFRLFMGWNAPIILVTKLRGGAVGDVVLTIPERFTAPLQCSKL